MYDFNPRTDYDNATRFCIAPSRNHSEAMEIDGFDWGDYSGWDEAEKGLYAEHDAFMVRRLGRLDHSMVVYYVGGGPHWSDAQGWDSGTCGFVVVTKEAVAKEYVASPHYPTPEAWAEAVIKAEVEDYTRWANGWEGEDEDEGEEG